MKKKEYLLKKYLNKNYLYLMTAIPYEIKELTLKEFLEEFTSRTKIESMFMQNGSFREELVVFNPKSIKIIENILEIEREKPLIQDFSR